MKAAKNNNLIIIIIIIIIISILLLSFSSCNTTNTKHSKAENHEVNKRFNVYLVEAAFPVHFSQAIANNNHYIAYYDKDKNFCIGYRKLTENTFQKTVLNSKIGWDSHNYTVIVVDDQGYIHVSGNIHNVLLNYWRSKKPYDASEFEEINFMTGKDEQSVTYPHFLKTNSGQLLFHYRNGGSGHGYEVYNLWHPETKTWSRFLDQPLIDGKDKRNAYMSGPFYEKDEFYHLYWVWRDTPDCASNHTFSYAKSKDLKHWKNAAGEAVASPMVFGETKLVVDDSSGKQYGNGMLNGVQKHTFDSKNRMVLCNMKYDSDGNSQLYVYRLNQDKKWGEKQITNWEYRFNFSGWGSIKAAIELLGMKNLDNGTIEVDYEHPKYGKSEIILDENTLASIATKVYEPTYPTALDNVLTKTDCKNPIQVNINQQGKYILRWETLEPNNDKKPEGCIPKPYMMELIELE